MGFPGGSDCKESTCNAGDLGSIPGLGRSPGGGHGNPLQYSCLENPHGQKNLAEQSMGTLRVGHSWATKHRPVHSALTTMLSVYCLIHLFPATTSEGGALTSFILQSRKLKLREVTWSGLYDLGQVVIYVDWMWTRRSKSLDTYTSHICGWGTRGGHQKDRTTRWPWS